MSRKLTITLTICLPESKNKKPLTISTRKWLFYMVGPPRLELGTNGL